MSCLHGELKKKQGMHPIIHVEHNKAHQFDMIITEGLNMLLSAPVKFTMITTHNHICF